MRITYDKGADALYIQLKEAKAAESIEVNEGIIIDLDESKNPLGVEILYVSSRLSPQELAKVNLENLVLAK